MRYRPLRAYATVALALTQEPGDLLPQPRGLQPLLHDRRQGGQLAPNLFRQVVPVDDHGGAKAEQDATRSSSAT